MKNYFDLRILLLGFLLLFQSCNKDEIIDFQELKNNNIIIENVSFFEVENNPLFGNIISSNTSKIDIYKSNTYIAKKASSNYVILTDEVSKASYKEYEAYSFRVDNPEQPLFTFDNFVIQKNHDNSIEEFILRYEYDQFEYVKNGTKKFLSISKFDTDYNLISSDNTNISNKYSSKNSLTAKSSNCSVTTKIYHRIPDGREFEFKEGSTCHHPGECTIIVEYTLNCTGGGGGGGSTGGGTGGGTGPGGGGSGPDNGGPNSPITTLQPIPEREGPNTIQSLRNIIEAPLARVPSMSDIVQKNSALIAYLTEINQPVFQDLSILLATNMYDSNLSLTDKTVLWHKARAIYEIVKTNNPQGPNSFDIFFSYLDNNEKQIYTKNTMETALFSSVKSIVGEFWPKNTQEWSVLFKLMGPLLLEVGIEFLPGGGVFNSGNDALAGLSSGDYTAAVVGVVGIIMEFVPWAKLAKVATKIYDIGKSAFKIFKVAYNFLGSVATAIEHGIKTVLDGSGVLKLIDNSRNQVAKIVDGVMTVSKHGIKAVDGSVIFRTADDVNLSNPNWVNNPPYSSNVPVTEFVTSQAESVFIRVYNSSSPNGQWMMHINDFNKLNLDSHNIRDILALPELPTKYAKVTVPAGTNLRTGGVRHQNWGDGFLNGGGTQFQILDDYNLQGFIFEELGNLN